jgi:hypothetical protein
MKLKNNDQRTSLFWLATGGVISYSSLKYGLGTITSPGPGLFPFLSGLSIVILGLVVFSQQLSLAEREGLKDPWVRTKWPRILLVMGALIVYIIFFKLLGFILDTIWLLAFLMRAIEPISWKKIIFGSVVSALSSYIIFQVWLEAQLPKGIFGF